MINNNRIDKLIELEQLHRYVFDNIYVQRTKKSNNDDLLCQKIKLIKEKIEEQKILKEYKSLFNEYPNFREELWNEYNKRLSKINFNRYGFNKH